MAFGAHGAMAFGGQCVGGETGAGTLREVTATPVGKVVQWLASPTIVDDGRGGAWVPLIPEDGDVGTSNMPRAVYAHLGADGAVVASGLVENFEPLVAPAADGGMWMTGWVTGSQLEQPRAFGVDLPTSNAWFVGHVGPDGTLVASATLQQRSAGFACQGGGPVRPPDSFLPLIAGVSPSGEVRVWATLCGRFVLDGKDVLESPGTVPVVLAFDADAKLRWARIIAQAPSDVARIAVDGQARTLIVGLDRVGTRQGRLVALLLDADGMVTHNSLLSEEPATASVSFAQGLEDGFLVAGRFFQRLAGDGFEVLASSRDDYLLELDADGKVVFARSLDGPGEVQIASVYLDRQERLWLSGTFVDTARVAGGPLLVSHTSPGMFEWRDAFVAELTAKGEHVASTSVGAEGGEYAWTAVGAREHEAWFVFRSERDLGGESPPQIIDHFSGQATDALPLVRVPLDPMREGPPIAAEPFERVVVPADAGGLVGPLAVEGNLAAAPSAAGVELFRASGARWEYAGRVPKPEGASEYFGDAVALANGRLFVADSGATDFESVGSLIMYVRRAETFELVDMLKVGWDPHPHLFPLSGRLPPFGHRLAATSDTLFVANAGVVRVYDVTNDTFVPAPTLSSRVPRTSYGWALALDGDTLAVGAPSDSLDGSVYWYGAQDKWSGAGPLLPSDARGPEPPPEPCEESGGDVVYCPGPIPRDGFGTMLALDPATLAVAGYNPWHVHLFDRAKEHFSEVAVVRTPQRVGSLAVSGTLAAVGAPEEDAGAAMWAGAVYVYANTNNAWRSLARLASNVPNARGRLGADLALVGDRLLVTSPADPVGGSLLVFDPERCTDGGCLAGFECP